MSKAAALVPAGNVAAVQVTPAATADIPVKENQARVQVAPEKETGIMLITTVVLVLITAILAAAYIFEKMKIVFLPK